MRAFAIVPAAGRSRRMGEPKLLLPWNNATVIEAVIAAWRRTHIEAFAVVVDPRDGELIELLQRHDLRSDSPPELCLVVAESPPPEMKDSVRLALHQLQSRFMPSPDDAWLLAPADMPALSSDVANRLINVATEHAGEIVGPVCAGRRGHPVLFPWRLALEVGNLGEKEGVNQLLHLHNVIEVECSDECLADDVDSPAEYRRLSRRAADAERRR